MSAYLRRALAALACSAFLAPASAEEPPARPKQAVIISFDSANDIAQWQRSRRLAALTGARFTYFLSCVFLLSPETRATYQAPGIRPGRSNIGFAPSKEDIAARLNQIWLARSEGHEIASHACGHYDGGKWSKEDWLKEFSSFSTVLADAWRTSGLAGEPRDWRRFVEEEIFGFRAPYLSTGKGLSAALSSAGYRYDASGVSRGPVTPQARNGVTEFALPQIAEGPKGRRVIAMDYNLFVRHSGGFEQADANGQFEERTLVAFRRAFDEQYNGERIPLQLGFHFTQMNGGAYWRALERFAHEVCVRADVECISYADYLSRSEPRKSADKVGG
ncbi:polysaccharide deacetylase [Pseudaminobacter sp. 19-2017]|uniref:Polysaccharide deacetylase n=1 Tax=Pseudaminobacter soli (ex Zhang et al. 2022) TaxID=2831468 RepID=A0A942DWE9_9HYPH|nr:polysaccharide deacetylase [Pseudaminobacter soli]MBS3648316.1 polysaccharide deacetylase [Pseudaminobacter soli]